MRHLWIAAALVAVAVGPAVAQSKKKDSPAVAAARKKLTTPVTVDYKETRLEEVMEDLKKQVENLSIKLDNAGGVSNNITVTYKATEKPLAEVLDGMFKRNDLGYVIGEKKGDAKYRYRGWLIIKKGKYRGEPEDEAEGGTAKAGSDEKPEKPAKEKPAAKEKPEGDKGDSKPEENAETAEHAAARKLKLAKLLAADGLTDKAKARYQEIVKKYPDTKAAKEAKELLEKLEQ